MDSSIEFAHKYLTNTEVVPDTGQPPHLDNGKVRLPVVLYPPDEGFWSVCTCVLGFLASMILDGVCLSLFLYDSRVGMTEQVSRPMLALEHLAIICLCRHLIGCIIILQSPMFNNYLFTEPFTCAYINRYGFRYCLFFGSVLSVTWITTLLLLSERKLPVEQLYFVLAAVVGGIGIGMIKTAFVVLISSLFLVNRQYGHLCLQLGSSVGMLIIPPITEFSIIRVDWKSSMYLHLVSMCFTLIIWLLVTTPVPLIICDETSEHANFQRHVSGGFVGTVANKKSRFMPITEQTPLCSSRSDNEPVGLNAIWLYENKIIGRTCVRNLTNIFKDRTIGGRPMYRHDILFESNIMLLAANLKSHKLNPNPVLTSVLTVDDVNDEKHNRFRLCSIAVTRVLKSMFNMSIWRHKRFLAFAVSEALVESSYLIPFVFIKGIVGQKTSAEAMITLIAGCLGLLVGRGVGFLLHETSSTCVPMYHVCLVLFANSLSLLLCSKTINVFVNILPCFGLYGFTRGYYESMRNTVFCLGVFPLKKFINVRGQIALVRAISSCLGLLSAITILENTLNMANVYMFAASLAAFGGLFLALLN
ncbi:Major facilitator superfamily domain [Cinara cedri]|uniref:Major facilitator superfamily domain n=1 Tax=Cinara cedri TaxID=506608 RepID=A0A5E4MD48_9HEMI|nr:Major facilitator superfamily domain [Cinara cedri]